ncbi:Outer dynein arm protein 1 [Eumeta japonica]|uniref:Outer dynein arm protein 1 n=1 Tax=Eumeta variegata TaxID=151549 RepID=A0A4C2A2Z7_EUMVA|nr:Outer dynein arm protein 1 [Eumeta japonica]
MNISALHHRALQSSEFTGDDDVDKLIQEFNRREEENYALFNYVNEVNSELKNLNDNVKTLRVNIEDEKAKHEAKIEKEQDSIDSLKVNLEERRQAHAHLKAEYEKSRNVLDKLMRQIHELALTSNCDSLPLLKLLGRSVDVNESNSRLYIKSLETKILEIVDIVKIDEALQRQAEAKERTPPSTRRRAGRGPRRTPRERSAPTSPHPRADVLLAAS